MAAAAKWTETAMLVIDMQVGSWFLDFGSASLFFCTKRMNSWLPTCELWWIYGRNWWWLGLQKDFVDPAMGSPVLVAGGEGVVPTVAEAVSVARERGIFVVWVS